jgi:hypothetical protein
VHVEKREIRPAPKAGAGFYGNATPKEMVNLWPPRSEWRLRFDAARVN